jgi:hypothetical protein
VGLAVDEGGDVPGLFIGEDRSFVRATQRHIVFNVACEAADAIKPGACIVAMVAPKRRWKGDIVTDIPVRCFRDNN